MATDSAQLNAAKAVVLSTNVGMSDSENAFCPRCQQLKHCDYASLHEETTLICPSCHETEIEERMGTIAAWRGRVYWRVALR